MKKMGIFSGIQQEKKEIDRFFKETPKNERDITFYSEGAAYYPFFEGVIDELTKTHQKKIAYVTSDPNDPIQNGVNTNINVFYISRLLSFFMPLVDSSVFVMTLTDLGRSYLKRSKSPVHYMYMFHAIVSTHMMYTEGAFDNYDSLLCGGPHEIEEIRKYENLHNLKQKELVEAGYYRLERIYDAYRKYDFGKIQGKKKTILIAPSWGEKNVIESYGCELSEMLLGAGYKVIVRPHPETTKRSPDVLDNLKRKFEGNADFLLEQSTKTDDSMLVADLLISDCSGITLEYAFGTERPVLFLDVPVKVQNKNYKELGIEPLELAMRSEIGVTLSPEKIETLPIIVESLIAKSEAYKTTIRKLREKYVFSFGKSSEIGAAHILTKI